MTDKELQTLLDVLKGAKDKWPTIPKEQLDLLNTRIAKVEALLPKGDK